MRTLNLTDTAACRAELLRDSRGIIGLTFKGEVPPGGRQSIVLRPDQVPDHPREFKYCLHPVPPMPMFKRSVEFLIADSLLTAILARAGLPRYAQRDGGVNWWGFDDKTQAENRRRYHGAKRLAFQVTNKLIRQALSVAEPDALRLARKFPLPWRYSVYCQMARSPRMRQLAETFPMLLVASSVDRRHTREAAIRAVKDGSSLKGVADLMLLPMALRRVKPGACRIAKSLQHALSDNKTLSELIHTYLPEGTPAQRRWLWAVWQASHVGGPYVDWVARHAGGMGALTIDAVRAQVADLGDWVKNSYASVVPDYIVRALVPIAFGISKGAKLITRPFSPDMSLATARALSGAWHEDVALANPSSHRKLPPPWRNAAKVGDFDVIPLATAAEIAAEGRAMHHCVASYIDRVANGTLQIYSVRKNDARVATVSVGPLQGGAVIDDMRGPCNAVLPKPLQAKLRRWAEDKSRWSFPQLPAFSNNSPFDEELPF